MKEFDLSLIVFEVKNHEDYSDIKNITGEAPIKKTWSGVSCVEFLSHDSGGADDLPSMIEGFLQSSQTRQLLALPKRKALRIGVFFDTANCSFHLPKETLSQLSHLNLDVFFSCYPCANE